MPTDGTLEALLDRNRAWALERTDTDPEFFRRLAEGQEPEVLWIGCADSRVPSSTVVGAGPGELFVHRNVANLVVPDDDNAWSAIQYAVEALGVAHVIVCGHYGCGGVAAALDGEVSGAVDRWVEDIRRTARRHAGDLERLPDRDQRWRRLCELNVAVQVERLRNHAILRDARSRGGGPEVHGWIYDLEDGRLRDLASGSDAGKNS